MKFMHPEPREQGIVSILSVIFFIILMSIITISFLRIVTDEQTQVLQDDLSKGALAAARSGVEDAKRAMLLCRSKPAADQPQCYSDLSNQTCPGVFGSATMVGDLGLSQNADGSIRVGDPTNDNNQRYTCVTISRATPDYQGIASDGLGTFIPLRTAAPGGFNQVRISWHETARDGPAAIPPAGSISLNTNPRRTEWQNGVGVRYVAMPRIQLVQFDTAQPLSAQQDSSVGSFLVPNSSGSQTVIVSAVTQNGMPKRAAVNCTTPQAGFMCTAVLNLNFAQLPTAQYFMLLKTQYGTPHYKVELLNSGTVASLDDVQPEVDSTGAAANVYKRIISRIEYQADTFFTSNSIESGSSVCKDFSVAFDSFTNPCAALVPAGTGVPGNQSGPVGTPLP